MQGGDKHGKAMHFKQFESMLTFRMSVLQHTFSKQLTLSKMYVVTYEPSHVELFKMHCFTMFITNLCLNFLMKFSTFLRFSSLSDTRYPADLYPRDMFPAAMIQFLSMHSLIVTSSRLHFHLLSEI